MDPAYSTRPATPEDAEAILAVGIARDTKDVGHPDWSLEDVREEMGELGPGDALVVADEGGALVAFGFAEGNDGRINVHPDAEGRGIGTALREWVEERLRGHGKAEVHQHIFGANDGARTLLAEAGYEVDQRYWRMVRMLDGSEPEPRWPGGARPRPFARPGDEAAAYALVEDAFADIPGNVSRTFEQWRGRALGDQFDAGLATVVGEMDGVALTERWEDGEGYLSYLAVARDWRGRGLGRALLQATLRNFADAGLRKAILSVNGRNESATELYRSAGMEVEFNAERFVKPLA
jgi:mycothiol synthase